MNVLQLCKFYPPVLGGIELVAKTITKAHHDLKDKAIIVAFSDISKQMDGDFSELIYLIKQDIFFMSAPINLTFLFKFRELIIRHNIERVYIHLPNPFMHEVLKFSSKFLKKKNVEVIAIYHSDIINQKVLGTIYNYYFCLSKKIYDKWICSSQKLWESSPILNKIDGRRKVVIPFCTEGNLKYRARKKFHGKLLAVGRLVPYKGFEFLIRAINQTNYELHVVGDGPEYKKLKSISKSNIILHRKISDLEKKLLFDQSDIMIVSSANRAEAYGMIIVEAFESGLPVIASNLNSGVTYLVQNEKTGLVFETKNSIELIQSIKKLEDNDFLYQQISINARKFFDENLTYEQFKNKIKKLQQNTQER